LKLKLITKVYSDLTFLLADKAIKKEEINKQDIAHQKLLRMQYEQINKLYKGMIKDKSKTNDGLMSFFNSIKEIEVGMSKLQQNIGK
jgi:hypothetical protein